MKYLRSIAFLLVICLFSGCIREDLSHCPVYTAELSFAYYGDGETDIFHSKIHSTDLFIFNTDGLYLQRYQLGSSWLAENSSLRLDLPAGDYQIVTWGNLFSESEVEVPAEVRHFDLYRLTHPNYNTDKPIASNDSLYYNMSHLSVVSHRISQQVLLFRSARIKLILYAEIEKMNGESKERVFDPDIRFENLYTNYDFYMQLTGERVNFTPVRQYTSSGRGVLAIANVLRFSDSNPITVLIQDSEYNIYHRLSLEEFMKKHHITVDNRQEVTVSVHAVFGKGGNLISIDVADWEVIDVEVDY